MKLIRLQAAVAIITVLYACSLFPRFTPMVNVDFELCSAIQHMKQLHETSASDQSDFHTALSDSIQTLKAIAGISAVIVQRSDDQSASNQTSFLIVVVKSPHLLSTFADPTILISEIQNNFLREDHSFTSLNCLPEEPPPNFLNC